MRLIVAIDHRFDRTPDGAIWTKTSFTYPFWQRYLSVFDHVRVVARMRDVEEVEPRCTRCDGEGISFARVPHYLGPVEYLTKARQVTRAVHAAVEPTDAVLLRINGQIASTLEGLLRRTGHPYGVEVVGDPWEGFAPGGAVKTPLRPFFRWLFTYRVKRQCAGACAAAYVTQSALQQRYPPAPDAFTTHYSSIVLEDEDVVAEPRIYKAKSSHNLVTVGTLNNLSKGQDVLIEAVGRCVQRGLDLRVTLVGGGKYTDELSALADTHGLNGRVNFVGWVASGGPVQEQLDQADLFVLPSRQEGLSRATIEAMARGLPCITSSIGGMSEIMRDEELVPANNVEGLSRKIEELLADPKRMTALSARNLEIAKNYRNVVLSERWTAMYRYLRDCTEAWLHDRGSAQQI